MPLHYLILYNEQCAKLTKNSIRHHVCLYYVMRTWMLPRWLDMHTHYINMLNVEYIFVTLGGFIVLH